MMYPRALILACCGLFVLSVLFTGCTACHSEPRQEGIPQGLHLTCKSESALWWLGDDHYVVNGDLVNNSKSPVQYLRLDGKFRNWTYSYKLIGPHGPIKESQVIGDAPPPPSTPGDADEKVLEPGSSDLFSFDVAGDYQPLESGHYAVESEVFVKDLLTGNLVKVTARWPVEVRDLRSLPKVAIYPVVPKANPTATALEEGPVNTRESALAVVKLPSKEYWLVYWYQLTGYPRDPYATRRKSESRVLPPAPAPIIIVFYSHLLARVSPTVKLRVEPDGLERFRVSFTDHAGIVRRSTLYNAQVLDKVLIGS